MTQGIDIKVGLFDLPRQRIRIAISGAGVLQLEGNMQAHTGDPEEIKPDVIRVFTDCASLGMFCGAVNDPARSSARILASEADIEKREQIWRVELQAVDPGGSRVLLNVLRSMELESIEVASLEDPAGAAREAPMIDTMTVAYPGVPEPLAFSVDYEPPERSGQPRAVQLIFTREPEEVLVERACSAFEKWSLLLMLGGYAPADLEPQESTVLPDIPFQYDAFTVEQSFELFLSDETAFGAIVNWARRERGPSFPIGRISIF